MVHHDILIHSLIPHVKVWMDFFGATRDPRALVMAQVAYMIATKEPPGPPAEPEPEPES